MLSGSDWTHNQKSLNLDQGWRRWIKITGIFVQSLSAYCSLCYQEYSTYKGYCELLLLKTLHPPLPPLNK